VPRHDQAKSTGVRSPEVISNLMFDFGPTGSDVDRSVFLNTFPSPCAAQLRSAPFRTGPAAPGPTGRTRGAITTDFLEIGPVDEYVEIVRVYIRGSCSTRRLEDD
jgi:hypothetical protein